MSNQSDTPRTDEFEDDLLHTTYVEGQDYRSMMEHARTLERELTAARQEIERLDTASIHSCSDTCQRPNCVLRRELAKYKSIAETAINDHEASEIRNHLLTEQRDRLAAFIQKCEIWFSQQPIGFPMQKECNEALQSLSTNTPVNQPQV